MKKDESGAMEVMESLRDERIDKDIAKEMLQSMGFDLIDVDTGYLAVEITEEAVVDSVMDELGYSKSTLPEDDSQGEVIYKKDEFPIKNRIARKEIMKIIERYSDDS